MYTDKRDPPYSLYFTVSLQGTLIVWRSCWHAVSSTNTYLQCPVRLLYLNSTNALSIVSSDWRSRETVSSTIFVLVNLTVLICKHVSEHFRTILLIITELLQLHWKSLMQIRDCLTVQYFFKYNASKWKDMMDAIEITKYQRTENIGAWTRKFSKCENNLSAPF